MLLRSNMHLKSRHSCFPIRYNWQDNLVTCGHPWMIPTSRSCPQAYIIGNRLNRSGISPLRLTIRLEEPPDFRFQKQVTELSC
jgi:hypothetical protein